MIHTRLMEPPVCEQLLNEIGTTDSLNKLDQFLQLADAGFDPEHRRRLEELPVPSALPGGFFPSSFRALIKPNCKPNLHKRPC